MKTALSLGLAAALTLASAALAADGPGRDYMGRGQRADANGDGRVTLQETQGALRERIMRMDANHDGRVTQAEMEALRGQWRERREQRGQDVFARLDTDHSGQLSQQEFTAGRDQMRERRRERMGERGEHRGMGRGDPGERFARLDADRDGSVSAAELDRAAAERFSRLDANHDGALTADERPDRGERMRGRDRDGDDRP